jgi:hypothetical protein
MKEKKGDLGGDARNIRIKQGIRRGRVTKRREKMEKS